jgi:TolB-like protein
VTADLSLRAVFLSYASQDAEAARRICDALRAAGIEVWFDQSELRGGEAWDQKIRREIRDCALFMPIVSSNTASRPEGYFRLEWAVADQRTQMMARNKVFIVPVCVDATPEGTADLPESFHRVQWTRLPAGATPSSFCDWIANLLRQSAAAGAAPNIPPPSALHTRPAATAAVVPTARRAATPFLIAAVAVCVLAALAAALYYRKGVTTSIRGPASAKDTASEDGFSPPPHSVAVLPFVNMSADKEQEYFSDGLSEELLDSLAKVHDLQVAARTSSFSFKGEHVELADIARKLNVGALLEGSVRRDGTHVRITAQLINALTGFHLWSETYDRDLKNVLALQTEIATAVTSALQATLLPSAAAAIELGGTKNPAALDAYLHGELLLRDATGRENLQASIAAFETAIQLDPTFAKAYASYALALIAYDNNYAPESELHAYSKRARAAAQKAIELAPDLGESHAAMARLKERVELDFPGATREYARALELSPSNASILMRSGAFDLSQGLHERGLASVNRAQALDPLNIQALSYAASFAAAVGELPAAKLAVERGLALSPDDSQLKETRGQIALYEGRFEAAIADCTVRKPDWVARQCLVVAYDKLHRHTEADAQIAAMTDELGNSVAYQMAEIFALRGESPKALDWLDTAYRLHDSGLSGLKTDLWLDSLRQEPRFRVIEHKLYPET